MKLGDWLKQKKMSQLEFGEVTGFGQHHISELPRPGGLRGLGEEAEDQSKEEEMNNVGFDLPKGRRPVKGSNDGTLDVQSAVDFMDGASEQVFHLSKELVQFAANASALVNGPLKLEAVALLIQNGGGLPRTAGGRPLPLDVIIGVLEAAARLGDRYLKPKEKK